ncbi:PRC and DUF2382 domain-containing protein [Nocardia wallacei]|uniref:PRC and DUF2382 domain-containing protein n=1 Tax=Nocardia wallacei TaxID=480035 RepID=UPI002455055B|nr:PRC and DUF2382 domain-containing protein [Nocardia wallacei]
MTYATLESVIGATAYDLAGEKIGKVKKIYLDNATGEPTWVAVSTGLFGSDSMVPLAGAQHRPDAETLQVQVDKEHVKSAPYLDDDGHITRESEQELFAHYGIDSRRAGWNAYGRQQIRPGPDEPMTHGNDELVRSEERLRVGTERQEAGTARLRKYVVSEDQTVDVPTTHEEARVEREPVTDPSQLRSPEIGEQEREVTLHEDRVTVHKESVPVERVRLEVDEVEDRRTVSDTVRKERIEAEGVETDERRGSNDH